MQELEVVSVAYTTEELKALFTNTQLTSNTLFQFDFAAALLLHRGPLYWRLDGRPLHGAQGGHQARLQHAATPHPTGGRRQRHLRQSFPLRRRKLQASFASLPHEVHR